MRLEIAATTRWVAAQIDFLGEDIAVPAGADFSAGNPGLRQTGRPAADNCGTGCRAAAVLVSVPGDGVLALRSAPLAAAAGVVGVRCVDILGQDVACQARWVPS